METLNQETKDKFELEPRKSLPKIDAEYASKSMVFESYSEAKLHEKGSADRSKTSLRLKYEAETAVIQKKIGHLEDIRISLGLSRRKMAQLLLVDPSAWTRWTKNEDSAPPHIFRALQWYMALIDKQPGWHPQNSFNSGDVVKVQEERLNQVQSDLERQISYLKSENNRLETELIKRVQNFEDSRPLESIERQVSIELGWKLVALLNLLGLLAIFLWKTVF
jgi:transcriptional regulator with XRE-family HTH domain